VIIGHLHLKAFNVYAALRGYRGCFITLGPGILIYTDERLLAGVVAIAAAWRWRATFATMVASLLALHFFDGLL